MGRKGNWFSNVKKALSPESKEKKDEVWKIFSFCYVGFASFWITEILIAILQKSSKSKKKWFGKQKHSDSDAAPVEAVTSPPLPPQEEVKLTDADIEQNNHENHIAVSITAVAEPVVVTTETAPEVAQAPRVSRFAGKLGEEAAAIKIQTAFRGYLVCLCH